MQRQVQLDLRTVNDINLMRGARDYPSVFAVHKSTGGQPGGLSFPRRRITPQFTCKGIK